MRCRRWTAGWTAAATVAAATSAATAITIMIVCRNWRWWGGGAKHPDHLFRWEGLLFAVVSRRTGHRPGAAGHVCRRTEVGASSGQRAALGRSTGRIVVVVRRMRPLDNRVRCARRRIVQAGTTAQRTGAACYERLGVQNVSVYFGVNGTELGAVHFKGVGVVWTASLPVSDSCISVWANDIFGLEAVWSNVCGTGRCRMVQRTVRWMVAPGAPSWRAQVAKFGIIVASSHRQGVSATRGAP